MLIVPELARVSTLVRYSAGPKPDSPAPSLIALVLLSTPRDQTVPFAPNPGSNARSTEPFAFNRATPFRGTPLTSVKSPTITTLPPATTRADQTVPLAPFPGLNVVSSEPSVFRRAI